MTSIIDQAYNCKVTCDNNEQFFINANRLHNLNLDHWAGWHCEAGMNRLWIEHDGSIYGSECKNDYLGNIFDEWKILTSPTICQKTRCTGCTDDLILKKQLRTNL